MRIESALAFPLMGQTEEQFRALPAGERALLVAAWLVDVVKVREVGANRGEWVARFLAGVGLGPGFAWCAAFVSWCHDAAGVEFGPKRGRASVRRWLDWAVESERLTLKPERGDLFLRVNPNGTGHIGFFVRPAGPGVFQTIEGNSNKGGGRDGDGAYRLQRAYASGWRFVRGAGR